jgi:hypothetical protein
MRASVTGFSSASSIVGGHSTAPPVLSKQLSTDSSSVNVNDTVQPLVSKPTAASRLFSSEASYPMPLQTETVSDEIFSPDAPLNEFGPHVSRRPSHNEPILQKLPESDAISKHSILQEDIAEQALSHSFVNSGARPFSAPPATQADWRRPSTQVAKPVRGN